MPPPPRGVQHPEFRDPRRRNLSLVRDQVHFRLALDLREHIQELQHVREASDPTVVCEEELRNVQHQDLRAGHR